MKKLATIERIVEVYSHPNADKLELVKVLGYQCVVPLGKYNKGDLVIYIKPDTMLPEKEWADSFRKYAPKRVKSIKLRSEFSEGIIADTNIVDVDVEEGLDLTDILGVLKWEEPIPNDINAKGFLPLNIPMTDENRWENFVDDIPYGEKADLTLKIDGQSNSFYYNDGNFGVLGRKLELKLDSVNKYTYHIGKLNIDVKLKNFCEKHGVSLCIRGESYGQGIQKMKINPHSKFPNAWAMFSVWNIKERRYERKGDEFYFLDIADELGLPTVDVIEKDVVITPELIQKYSSELKELNGRPFEGIVVQHAGGSFKIINKHYDSKK